MKNDMNALREELFATLRALRDEDNPMDIARARAISEVSKVLTETAKVEVDYLKVTQGTDTGFIKPAELPNGIVSIRKHQIK